MAASTWGWLARHRQRDVLQLCLRHLDHVVEVVRHARNMVSALLEGDQERLRSEYREVFEAERRADAEKHRIIEELSTGFIHPVDREELIRLVLSIDDIADHAKAGSRRLLYIQPGEAPSSVVEKLLVVAERLVDATEKAREAVNLLPTDPRSSIRVTHEIEAIEEEVDEIRSETEEWLFKNCESVGVSRCLVLLKVLESFETATDKAEDLGDVVRSIALLGF